jgi:hypothetical protein
MEQAEAEILQQAGGSGPGVPFRQLFYQSAQLAGKGQLK